MLDFFKINSDNKIEQSSKRDEKPIDLEDKNQIFIKAALFKEITS